MTQAQIVVFHLAKAGSSDTEWEDGAGADPGDPATGRDARCIVVDGATEAYDSIRWVGLLVDAFLGLGAGERPALTDGAMDQWFGLVQERWQQGAPRSFATFFEEESSGRTGRSRRCSAARFRDSTAVARPGRPWRWAIRSCSTYGTGRCSPSFLRWRPRTSASTPTACSPIRRRGAACAPDSSGPPGGWPSGTCSTWPPTPSRSGWCTRTARTPASSGRCWPGSATPRTSGAWCPTSAKPGA